MEKKGADDLIRALALLRGAPWRVELSWDITHAWDGKQYHPYLGWTLNDFKSRYVHV